MLFNFCKKALLFVWEELTKNMKMPKLLPEKIKQDFGLKI